MLLPSLLKTESTDVRLRYGASEVYVRVREAPDSLSSSTAGASADDPLVIQVAEGIVETLCIRTEPVYRLRRPHPDVLEIGPVMGLLLGNRNHWYTDWYLSREPERVTSVYPHTGGLICAFSPRNVSLVDRCAYGLWYNARQGKWCFDALPLPSVIWRRSFKCEPGAVRRLQQATGARVFNSRRFDKWELYNIAGRDPDLLKHLPETTMVQGSADVFAMIKRHKSVVLKPSDLSRGRGIMFVARRPGRYVLTSYRNGAVTATSMSKAALTELLDTQVVGRRYLCQQRINLAQIDGGPFDVRIVMQRSPRGLWQCSGIECRVAGRGHLLTNIAMGGKALRLGQAVAAAFGGALDPAAVEARVVDLSTRLCFVLDQTGENFGEFGVDVALDAAGNAWLIEANVIPTFKGFRSIDMNLYRRLLATPLLYANHLAGFGEDLDGTVLSD